MLRDGLYWLPHYELDAALVETLPGLRVAERDQHFQDLYLAGHLAKRNDGADALALTGYRAANPDRASDFDALLASLRRLSSRRTGYLVRVFFEDICRGSHHFYAEDRDCRPQWIHSLLVLLGIAPQSMPSDGPWDLLSSDVRVAVECHTVDEFLDARTAARKREKILRSERDVLEYIGSAVVTALQKNVAETALERWERGQFADAVQSCVHVIRKVVEEKAHGVRDEENQTGAAR